MERAVNECGALTGRRRRGLTRSKNRFRNAWTWIDTRIRIHPEPQFRQQWGETIWREADGPTITASEARVAEELVNDELDRRFFRDRYEKATEAEAIYMAAMADLGDGRHSSSEIAAHMDMAQKELSVRRAALIDKGLVYNPVGSQLDFTVPQFAAYLRRIHPFDPTERPRRGRPRAVPGRRS